MTDDELKEKVMEKLDLTDGPDSREWIDLQARMREEADRLEWMPIFTTPPGEPDEKVYYQTKTRSGRVLKDEDFKRGGFERSYFSIQEHGREQAEALAFLKIYKTARE